jgi:hypothetical protein
MPLLADRSVPYAGIERIVTRLFDLLPEPSWPSSGQGVSTMSRKNVHCSAGAIDRNVHHGLGCSNRRSSGHGRQRRRRARGQAAATDARERIVVRPDDRCVAWKRRLLHHQKKAKLEGNWSTTVVGFSSANIGTLTGKIKPDGVTVTFKLKQLKQKGGFMVNGTHTRPSAGNRPTGGTSTLKSPCE